MHNIGHRDLLPAIKFAPLNFFLLSMSYPLKNDILVIYTLTVKTKSRRANLKAGSKSLCIGCIARILVYIEGHIERALGRHLYSARCKVFYEANKQNEIIK